MKRLGEKSNKKAITKLKNKADKDNVLVTKSIYSKEDAIEYKMRSVEPKLLGIKMVNYELKGMRKVWVPCYFMMYEFKAVRNIFFAKSKALNREGIIAAVFDANEMHTSHYDVLTEGEIPLVKKSLSEMSEDAVILNDKESLEKIKEQAEFSIKRQMLFKAYKTMESELELIEMYKFYREAWEMEMGYKDRTYIKYAYLDDYGVANERARGLSTKLDSM